MKYLKLLLLIMISGFMFGCAITGNKSDEDIVKERAQARYDALLKGDIKKAWGFTAPTYRQRVSADGYRAVMGGVGNWTKAEASRVTCEEERCELTGLITYKVPRMGMENTIPLDEVWIKTDGKWWIYHRR